MTQKNTIEEMHAAGKDYDEIEEATGAKRTYIRTIISKYKKTLNAGDMEDEEEEPEQTEPKEDTEVVDNGSMDFTNDLEGKNSMVGGKMADTNTGKEYHKAWVSEKAFECSCGCTLNRKSTYCPHCGIALNWEGL